MMNLSSSALNKHISNLKKTFTSGSKDQAIAECQSLVFLHPSNAPLRKLLAHMLAIIGKPIQAAKQLEFGFDLNPDDEELLFNLAISYRQGLAFAEALKFLSIYVEKYPTKLEGWGSLAECQFQLQLFPEALDSSSKAILLSNQESRIFYIRSKIYRSLKQYDEALSDLVRAIQLQDKNLSYVFEYAEVTLTHQGKHFAKPFFEKATQLQPTDYVELLYLGRSFYELGNINQSIDIFKKLISANQLLESAYLNLGSAHYVLKHYAEALSCYQEVLRLNKNSSDANINVANTLIAQTLFKESTPFIDRALEIDPHSSIAYKLRAQSRLGAGVETEILNDLLHAEKLNPSLESLQGVLLYSKLDICDWSDLAQRKEQLQIAIKNSLDQVLPFQATLFFDLPELHQIAAQEFVKTNFPISRHPPPNFRKSQKDKLRIAYLSPDFGQHPVSYLTAELFELHDRNQFEIIGVSLSYRKDDAYRLRIRNAVDIWLDVSQLTDIQAIELLRDQQIDIAIDLCGHTSNHRLSLWAHRIAPIQISYLGYLGTIGCSQYIDYLIADKTIIPHDYRQFYDEKIIYLPSYQVNDRKKTKPDIVVSKKSLGIPDDHFVFACLNNSFKYHPEIFAAWMKILSATPNSSLLLFGKNPTVIKNLQSAAIDAQVDSSRLIFLQMVDYETYLARLTCIDLFLDTTIYNAGTTASDALWMGVPVVTCIGKSFCARMAASLLVASSMDNLITYSIDEYISLAIELGTNPAKHQVIKNQLRLNIDSCKLFDSSATTRALEQSFQLVWNNFLSGALPKDVEISSHLN